MGSNRFSGLLPVNLGRLAKLVLFNATDSRLVGPMPPTAGGMVALRQLLLGQAGLNGTLPFGLGNLLALRHLDLSHNYFSGSLPLSASDLTALRCAHCTPAPAGRPPIFSACPLRLLPHRCRACAPPPKKGPVPAPLTTRLFVRVCTIVCLRGRTALPLCSYLNAAGNLLTGSLPPLGGLSRLL